MKKVRRNRILLLSAAIAVLALIAAAIVLIVMYAGRTPVAGVKLGAEERVESRAEENASLEPLMKYIQKSVCDASVQSIIVSVGNKVEKGDVVAYLDSDYTELYLSLLRQKGEAETSIAGGNDEARALYDSIEGQIDSLLSNETARSSMFVYADVSGRICRFKIKDGDRIRVGDELFEIDDDRAYIISFSVGSWTAPLPYGDVLTLYNSDGKALDFGGKVVKMTESGETYIYTLCVEGDCGAYYEDFESLAVKLDFGFSSGIKVPKSAVFTEDGKTYVYVLKSRKAQRTEVTVALENADSACITSGLKQGQTVITEPSVISDGSKVKVNY